MTAADIAENLEGRHAESKWDDGRWYPIQIMSVNMGTGQAEVGRRLNWT